MGKPVSADRSIRRMFWMDQRKTFSSWRTQPNIGLTWKKIDKVTQWIDLETWWNLEILKRTLPPCPTLSHCRPGFQNRYYQASVLGWTGIGFSRVHSGSAWLGLTLFMSRLVVTFVTFVNSVARRAATRAPVCWNTIRRGASVNMSRRFKTAEFNALWACLIKTWRPFSSSMFYKSPKITLKKIPK